MRLGASQSCDEALPCRPTCLGRRRSVTLALDTSLAGTAARLGAALLGLALLVAPRQAGAHAGGAADTGDLSFGAGATEWIVLPTFGYESDLGFGVGAYGNLARLDPGWRPYRLRVSAQVFFHLLPAPSGGLQVPFQNHYLLIDAPGLLGGRLRLNVDLRFRREAIAGYYGLGNASVDERPWDLFDEETQRPQWIAARRFHQYDRTYPALRVTARATVRSHLQVFSAVGLTGSWTRLYPGSKLEQDISDEARAEVSDLIVGLAPHALIDGTVGVLWDNRDDEFEPTRGGLHDVSVRGGGGIGERFGYVGLALVSRGYLSMWRGLVTIAARGRVDLLLGAPPLYELSAAGGLQSDRWATGGGTSLRGVPLQRYHGKIKLVVNTEARVGLARFRFLRQPTRISALGFVDLGRFFADWTPRPELDGRRLGVKVGLGGGLRIRFGSTLVVRADVGVSADGWGGYLDVDQVF